MELTQQTFTTVTLALHDYIVNMLLNYEEHNKSLKFLQEAKRGNDAYFELMGKNHPAWVRHIVSKGVSI